MKQTLIQKAVDCVRAKHPRLVILRRGLYAVGYLHITDLDHYLEIKVEHSLPTVLFDLKLYARSGNLDVATKAVRGEDIKDFPCYPSLKKARIIGTELPDNLKAFIPATAGPDDTREALQYIYINHGETVASNGGFLFLEKHDFFPKESFFISPKVVRVIELLGDVRKVRKEKKFLELIGGMWSMTVRQPEGEFLNYKRIMPDYPENGSWSADDISMLRNFIEKSKPFLPKTGIIYFTDEYVVCRNRELAYFDKLQWKLFNLPDNRVLAFNPFYLLKMFGFLNGVPLDVRIGKNCLEPGMFIRENRTVVLMPLRTAPDSKGIDAEELLKGI